MDGDLYLLLFLIATLLLIDCPLGKPRIAAADSSPQAMSDSVASSAEMPTLDVWERGGLTLVSASFSEVPDFICDSWCYESQMDFLEFVPLDNGRLQLRHRDRARPHVLILTTVTPEPGAVEFEAHMELDTANHPDAMMPETPTSLNLCWQLQRAPTFASAPDPYPEFVQRCFIFTQPGRTFLGDTVRRKIPCQPVDHQYNTPPWVQMYVGTWQDVPKAGPESWADYSPDRYITTVMGAISRDGRHLAAIVTDSATMMAQAWHDCMHNNPQWLPKDAPVDQRTWRVKIYVMEDDPEALLKRVSHDFPQAKHSYQQGGIQERLPVFRDQVADRMTFPLSWLSSQITDFSTWRTNTRAKVIECLLTPPPTGAFAPVVLAEQDRGSYVAQKIALNITADSRVLGYMLIPKGEGLFPAVLLLHDHGARFDIGKEKVIRPWDVPEARLRSANEWVQECYGSRWIGDELAKRGYVCFSTDALNWSDRGGAGYEGQQALAGNLLHLGMSFAGLIAHEDLRAAEFLATHAQVDSERVAAMGLSMGSFRTWQVSALSDHIAAGVAVCWMATVKGLMVPGNNQTGGQSAFTMTHPGLFNHLDYPDIASLACPKPMLFYNGKQDGLFPVPAVQEAYVKMRQIWESQNAGERLVTQLWDVPHEFNQEMQEAAFAWLAEQMR